MEGIQSSKVIYLSHMFSVFFNYVPVFVVAVLLVPSSHMFSQFICVYLSVFLFPFTVERKILQNQFSGPKFHIMYIYNHIYIYIMHISNVVFFSLFQMVSSVSPTSMFHVCFSFDFFSKCVPTVRLLVLCILHHIHLTILFLYVLLLVW